MQRGDRAPEFVAEDQNGQRVALSDFLGKHAVVLFFYPRDDSPICTREVCAFRDSWEDFTAAGAEVLGVSGDSVSSHARFASSHALPYRILSDPRGELRRAFAVPRVMGLLPGRVTFVIDASGIIRDVFESQFAAGQHREHALACVRSLSPP